MTNGAENTRVELRCRNPPTQPYPTAARRKHLTSTGSRSARVLRHAWTILTCVGLSHKETKPCLTLATNRLKAERIADPHEVIHRSRRQANAEMEVDLLLVGDL